MKKSFGQNYLNSKEYLNKIIEAVGNIKNETVLEIGSGSGVLTSELSKIAKKVYAVEIERSALKQLRKRIENEQLLNVHIVEKNFLTLNIVKLISNPFYVVGNIPYNISSKIMFKLFGEIDKPSEHLSFLKGVFLMLQYEVAKRISASVGTKDYSPLSITIQYFTKPELLFKVPATAFNPVPKVNSAFVHFKIKPEFPVITNATLLRQIIKIGFQQRRKKLINALSRIIPDKNMLVKIFDNNNLDLNVRAENLKFENYVAILSDITQTYPTDSLYLKPFV